MAAAPKFEALLHQLGSAIKLQIAQDQVGTRALSLSWPELDALLPDHGLPCGVVELSAPNALGGSTSLALSAIRAGQARAAGAWCAWLDPEATLHAPGVAAAGVELSRMLVVRCPRERLERVAVQVVASGAFEVVVVDFDKIPRAGADGAPSPSPSREGHDELPPTEKPTGKTKRWGPQVLIRKLALVAEPNGMTVLLLTDASKPRAVPWPVALRLELSRPGPRDLVVRVAKEKRGRIGLAKTIPFRFASRAVS